MDFDFTEEQADLFGRVVAFAKGRLNDDSAEREARGAFSRELWRECAEFGIHGLPLPAEYGGGAQDLVTASAAMEALGYGCRDQGLLFSIHAHMWSVQAPIVAFGTEDQKRRWLPKLSNGEWVGAHAMSEPDSGSDAFSLRTRAEKRGDRYVLNGAKTFSTNAPESDLIIVFATVNRDRGMWGVTAFAVERDTPGLTVSKPIAKMGLTTSPMGEIVFDDCEIPAENLLGKEGQGATVFNHSMAWERACILASDVGAMERQLETVIEYAKTRRQFDKPIGDFQLVAKRVADMKMRHETSRLLLYRAAAALAANAKDAAMLGAMAKTYISEAAVQSGLDAIQVHGGYGYMKEFEVERGLRDAIGGQLYSGTTDIQRMLIARRLGLSPKN
ncbi:MAG: acyl-CoA dehydrogenase family protein [Maricaulaceae bacterium]|jgi:alkylation response protein AidB-like acyl-CoA dehydrogenase